MQAPERFAIDWVQLDKDRTDLRAATRQQAHRAAHYYGDPIYSVADGMVVNLYDESDEQVPA